jgi:alkylation response protein AidB-like acyl-CoA dehydrogenase
MRASGSNHIQLQRQFVPREWTFGLTDPVVTPGTAFRVPGVVSGGAELGTVVLGNARHAYTQFLQLAGEKRPMMSPNLVRERVTAQVAAAEADAVYRSARLFLYKAISDVWDAVERGEEPPFELRVTARLAATHAASASLRIADLAFHNAGSSSIYKDGKLERAWRDAHVLAQNVAGSAANYEPVGRVLFGLPSNSVFVS